MTELINYPLKKTIEIKWSNKDNGLDLALQEGCYTTDCITIKCNNCNFTDKVATVIDNVLNIFENIPDEDKKFYLCPGTEKEYYECFTYDIYAYDYTIKIHNTGTILIVIITKGKFGNFNYIKK